MYKYVEILKKMPVVRVCQYCKKTRIWSTYGLLRHIEKHHPEKIIKISK